MTEKTDKRYKKCKKCSHIFEVLEKYVVDVGTDFAASFRYACPKCSCTEGIMEKVYKHDNK